eukprot:123043_1
MKALVFCVSFIRAKSANIAVDYLDSWIKVDPKANAVANSIAGYDYVTNKAYLLGGNCGTSTTCCTCKNDIFTFELDNIESNPLLSAAESTIPAEFRSFSQSYATVNRTIYFAESGKVYTYDMSTKELNTNFATLVDGALDNSCMATDGRYLFITGGRAVSAIAMDHSVATFMIYDLLTSQWIPAPSMVDNRYEHSCVAASNGFLYAIAGRDRGYAQSSEYRSDVERIYIGDVDNIQSYSWHKLAHGVSKARARTACIEMSEKIYVIGGETRGTIYYSDIVDVIDIANNDTMSVGPRLNEKRSAAAVIAGSDRRIYVFRGEGVTQLSYRSSVEISNVIDAPTSHPIDYPTRHPTSDPTVVTAQPTGDHTVDPTYYPTRHPSSDASSDPTIEPTLEPTVDPTALPTNYPTSDPIVQPTINTSAALDSIYVLHSAEVKVDTTTAECDPDDTDCNDEVVVKVYLGLGLPYETFWLIIGCIAGFCIVTIVAVICYFKRRQKVAPRSGREEAKSISVDLGQDQPEIVTIPTQDPNTVLQQNKEEKGEDGADENAAEDDEDEDGDDDLYEPGSTSGREGTPSGDETVRSPDGRENSRTFENDAFYKPGVGTPQNNEVAQ